MDTTANRLNLAMEMRNMKAVDLSEKTGIGKSSISQYRNGIVNPKQDRIYLMAQALNVNEMWLMGHDVPMERQSPAPPAAQPPTDPYRAPLTERDDRHGVKIPVLGRVVAGLPAYASEEIIDYEEIPEEMARSGEYFGLIVRGLSMLPTLRDGDVVIVKKQEDIDSGDIAIVGINGDEATVKEVKKDRTGITLIGHNESVFPPRHCSNKEIEQLPVTIYGKVVELRRKF